MLAITAPAAKSLHWKTVCIEHIFPALFTNAVPQGLKYVVLENVKVLFADASAVLAVVCAVAALVFAVLAVVCAVVTFLFVVTKLSFSE